MYAIDTETRLITPTQPHPPPVCVSVAWDDLEGYVLSPQELPAEVLDVHQLVGHNLAFDMSVLYPMFPREIIRAYREGRVQDTMIHHKLVRIEQGSHKYAKKGDYTLGRLAQRVGIELDKGADSWRLRYGELEGTPISDWPEEAVRYASEDARATYIVAQDQIVRGTRPDMVLQCRSAFVLHQITERGIAVDKDRVSAFTAQVLSDYARLLEGSPFHRVVKGKAVKDTKRLQAHVESVLGDLSPRTATGKVSTDRDTLLLCNTPEAKHMLELGKVDKLRTSFVPLLTQGAQDGAIHARYNELVSTGRTSSFGPNIQQLPRDPGVRECFCARPGYLLCSVDYDMIELKALAQICYTWFGYSHMREAILQGQDLHVRVAATLERMSYDDAAAALKAGDKRIKNARQFAKIANYGMAGGMGPASFSDYARGYGITLSVGEASVVKDAWLATWGEMSDYFAVAAEVAGDLGTGLIEQIGSGRLRGGVSYTEACNTMFQGLVADAAKDAMWHLWLACADERQGSPLYGSHIVAFLHDEYMVEIPETRADECAREVAKVVCDAAQVWMPDVPVTASPCLMRHWSKGAKETYNEDGEMIAWDE